VSHNLFWLIDEHRTKIEPFLPTGVRGEARVDDRRVFSEKAPCVEERMPLMWLSGRYGLPTTIYNRFSHLA
jgi:hypothetical protein